MENKNGVWSRPYQAPFAFKGQDGDFMVAPDGKKIFIASGRPLIKGAQPTRNHNIWVVERTSAGWSQPRPLEHPINTDWHESYPSVTKDGTLYFFKRFKDPEGKADIYRSRLVDGKYTKVKKLGGKINTKYNDLDGFIAQDESYLIFCSDRPGGYGNYDFYISFRKNGDSWTEPVNMGEKINSSAAEWIPYVTPDGKYFFFTSNKSGNREIYWVDAKIIEELKPKELK
jgi:Tol biopolymer transport system component